MGVKVEGHRMDFYLTPQTLSTGGFIICLTSGLLLYIKISVCSPVLVSRGSIIVAFLTIWFVNSSRSSSSGSSSSSSSSSSDDDHLPGHHVFA